MTEAATLVAALSAAQAKFPTVERNREGQVGPRKYVYADLNAILDSVRKVLGEHGLAIVQRMALREGLTMLITDLLHVGGEKIESELPLPIGNLQPQDVGKLITYYRRYQVQALLGISTADEDDDAQSVNAQTRHEPPRRPQSTFQRNVDAMRAKSPRGQVQAAIDALASSPVADVVDEDGVILDPDPLCLDEAGSLKAALKTLQIAIEDATPAEADRYLETYRAKIEAKAPGPFKELQQLVVDKITAEKA